MEPLGRDQNTRSYNFTYVYFWWSFQIRNPNPNSTHNIKDLHRNPIYVRYPFCPRNGCYQQRVLLCIYWVTLCSSVSLIIRFLESISRVWTFLNLLGYVFLRAKHHETSRGGRDSFTSEIPQPFTNSPEYQWQQRVINFS